MTLSQACTTSTTCIYQAAAGIETGLYQIPYVLMTDRCSNGPHTVWPNPNGPGGEVESENWVMDNFGRDPWAKNAMIQTAENVAKEAGITREECDALTLRRYEQYMMALADDRAFQKRYMFPAEVRLSKKKTLLIEKDEGVMETTAEGLAGLKPVLPDGVLTFGSQTHPADGNCALGGDDPGEGQGAERRPRHRDPGDLLRVFQGQEGLHGHGGGSGRENGPRPERASPSRM